VSVTFSKLADRINAAVKDHVQSADVDTQTILRLAFLEIGNALASGEDVFLEGFGRFYPGYRPARVIRSGLTNTQHDVSRKAVVRFNAFEKLNTRVQAYLVQLGIEDGQKDEGKDGS